MLPSCDDVLKKFEEAVRNHAGAEMEFNMAVNDLHMNPQNLSRLQAYIMEWAGIVIKRRVEVRQRMQEWDE